MASLELETILVATDLSEGSDPLIRAAAAVAELAGAELHVVHAFEVQSLPYASGALSESFDDLARDARERMATQLERAIPSTSSVRIASRDVAVYAAHRAILDRAKRVSADLIVLGPHRARPNGPRFLGTTADRVIRTASAPCLIVPGDLELPLRRIVVPIDLSEPARAALDLGIEWAEALGVRNSRKPEVIVLHVAPAELEAGWDESALREELGREIESASLRTESAEAVSLVPEVRPGQAASPAITEFAATTNAHLIVMGTHGYGAIQRALIGSIASGVARSAPCPVLLVPSEIWQEEGSGVGE